MNNDQELTDLLTAKANAEIEYRKALHNESLAWQNANAHTLEDGYTILEWQKLVAAAGEMTIAKNSAYLALCDAIKALGEYNQRAADAKESALQNWIDAMRDVDRLADEHNPDISAAMKIENQARIRYMEIDY